jgi:hypothetical protein
MQIFVKIVAKKVLFEEVSSFSPAVRRSFCQKRIDNKFLFGKNAVDQRGVERDFKKDRG